MPSLDSPLRFVPFLRPLVWGGSKLASQLNKTLPTAENYGESWEISDHPLHASVVATGPLAGTTLRSLMLQHSSDLLGPHSGEASFPWLVKFLDAQDWLSVQVHPGDELAQRTRPGERGKTEAWFVLAAEPGSRIYAGLQPGVGPEAFRYALTQGTVANLLHSFAPRAGDCVFLPAGTVHAVGGGVLLAEVQQSSDVTFRLFDWNRVDSQGRARQLHVEEGLAAIDWSRGPVQPINVPTAGDDDMTLSLVRCAYFDLSFFRQHRPFRLGGRNRPQVLIVLAGQARVGREFLACAAGSWETFGPGEVWLFPACLPEMTVEPFSSAKPQAALVGLTCGTPSSVGEKS